MVSRAAPTDGLELRVFEDSWTQAVVDLFTRTMNEIVPASHASALRDYINKAKAEELCRLGHYYASGRRAEFWILVDGGRLIATAAFEPKSMDTAELRRMLVDLPYRRHGLGSFLLRHCESRAQQMGYLAVALSTSAWQRAAIALYHRHGYREVGRNTSGASHKTIGAGVERVDFLKQLEPIGTSVA
jgi:GNAT superfamily N-acetyltransferase